MSIFYCLCFVEDISPDIAEEEVMEEKDPDLQCEENFRVSDDSYEKWKEVEEEDNDEMGKVNYQRLDVQTKEKEDLIKREFLVFIMHPKGVNIVWTCIKYNTTEEKDQ